MNLLLDLCIFSSSLSLVDTKMNSSVRAIPIGLGGVDIL